jgi:hypothetical protein
LGLTHGCRRVLELHPGQKVRAGLRLRGYAFKGFKGVFILTSVGSC